VPRRRLTAALLLVIAACSACGSAGTGAARPSTSAVGSATPSPTPS